jgi:hypothetical protein
MDDMIKGSLRIPTVETQLIGVPRERDTALAQAAQTAKALAGRTANALAVARDLLRAAERARAEAEKAADEAKRTADAARRTADEARQAADEARQARDAVIRSTSWRLTAPLRTVGRHMAGLRTAGSRYPRITRMMTLPANVIWWTITLQIHHRYRMSRRYRRGLRVAAAATDGPWLAVAPALATPSPPAPVSGGSIKPVVCEFEAATPVTESGLPRAHAPAAPHQRTEARNIPNAWAGVRAERALPPAASARRREGRLNVLYFSPFPSHPANHGNSATIQQFALRFQEMGHKVHFVVLQSGLFDTCDLIDMHAAWDTLDVIPNSIPMWADGGLIPFDGWYVSGLGERIRDLCDRYDIDVVFCSYVFQSRLLDYVPSYVLKVIDTHDKMGDRYDMLRKYGLSLEFFSCTPDEEGDYLRRADVVVARREEEAQYFDSITGRQTAVVIPHFEAPKFLEKAFREVRQVGIVASSNQINLAMVRECLEAIDRRLAGAECPFTVNVAGQVKEMVDALPADESVVFRGPWVNMRGFVRDIGEFYAEMDLILSPVTVGTGINVKTVQAMAYGKPLLSTSCGSKGIETGALEHMHADQDRLVESLFALTEAPHDLRRLAALSRERYLRFYDDSVRGIASLFTHAKLAPVRHLHVAGSVHGETANQDARPEMSKYPAQDYQEWANSVFGGKLPAPGAILASGFDPGGEWEAMMHNAMIGVECEYVECLLKEIRDQNVPGDLVEFGIHEDRWVNFLCERSESIGLTGRAVIGYDSYQDLSGPGSNRDTAFWKQGIHAAARNEIEQPIQTHSRPRIRRIEGCFADSLGSYEARQVKQIAYARIGCDVYEPALQCLNYLSDRLSEGAILVLDNWQHRIDVGVGPAFAQWVNAVPWLRFEFLFHGTGGHLYLRVRRRTCAA